MKDIVIEYLYLDLSVCDRCIGTDRVLEDVVEKLSPAFGLAGYRLVLKKTEMKDRATAERYRLMTSPTIRVNGRDICGTVEESDCGCCGEISGTQVDCRVFRYEGKDYTVAPEGLLAEGILRNAFLEPDEPTEYRMPDNLIRFFEGKDGSIPMVRSCC